MSFNYNFTTTDPRYHQPTRTTALFRFSKTLLNDKRDMIFVQVSLALTGILLPLAILFFIKPTLFSWWVITFYNLALLILLFSRYILMLHATAHRPLFKVKYRWLNAYIPWVLGPFFGQTPSSYFVHHIGMHHREGNLLTDLTTTMCYKRDCFFDWLKYFVKFNISCFWALPRYFWLNKRHRFFSKIFA